MAAAVSTTQVTSPVAAERIAYRMAGARTLAAVATAAGWVWDWRGDAMECVVTRGADHLIVSLTAESGVPYAAGGVVSGRRVHVRAMRGCQRQLTTWLTTP
jgi:hypothetical protein